MKPNSKVVLAFVLLVSLLLSSCNMPLKKADLPPTPAPPTIEPTSNPVPVVPEKTAGPDIVPVSLPGSPAGNLNQTVHDQVDKSTAPQKQAFGGDDFKNGKYERPFDKNMNYMPFADLVTVYLNREDPLWIYVSLKVNGPFTHNPAEKVYFMVEIDKDQDSRGDILIVTGTPKSTEWSTESVRVLTNPDVNVGGTVVIKPDPTLSEGRGYYEEIFNAGQGDDANLAMSRISKTDNTMVEIAFKNSLTGGEDGQFVWLPWSSVGILDWSLFEFNDHFTFEQAGYPIKDDMQNYPLKALWGVDNTCRVASGFKPDGKLQGLCPNYDPGPSRGSASECVPTCIKVNDKVTICTPC
jgi:hypothetical protein